MPADSARAHWWHGLVRRIATTAPGARFFSFTAHHLDRPVLRTSHGRTSLTAILTGLPVLTITTLGAKTGQPRTIPLLSIPDGDGFILIASNFGQSHHPAWYYNLRAHPEAQVLLNGKTAAYCAHETEGDERERCWRRAVDLYPGYAAYATRTGGRRIPVLVLKAKPNHPS
jgi:deazaflavin-dependent oxidoreductase (nitroreductase family)